MNIAELLEDAFGRVRESALAVVDGLSVEQLTHRLDGRGNSIGWLVWHLCRVQDDHVSEVAGVEQAWTANGWASRFGLPFDDAATGYGQGDAEVAAVRATPELLSGYCNDVHRQTIGYISTLVDSDLDRIVDERWDPPVSLGVRLVSVIGDDLMHLGQAELIRGLLP